MTVNIDRIKCLSCGNEVEEGQITTNNLGITLSSKEVPGGGFFGSISIDWVCRGCGRHQHIHLVDIEHDCSDCEEGEYL